MAIILITGGSGQIGSMLRTRLARSGRTLRLLDTSPPASPAGPGEQVIVASVTDMAAMEQACAGTDAVIHLAGVSGEAPWPRILDINIQGAYTVFEAARRAGVPRVIFASSNHAVGFTPRSAFPVPDYAFPAPDTYYGVSKVAGEGLAAQYHHRYGMDTICLRILSCFERPRNVRMLSTWLSPDDAGRLFEVCLTAPARASGWRSACPPTPGAAGCRWPRRGPWAMRRKTTPRCTRPRSSPRTANPTRTTRCWLIWAGSSPCPSTTRTGWLS